MESDRILVAAGLTAAAVVGAFVFWGPSTGSGNRRGRLAGLVNLGRTCFLNAILHALAACPHFVEWLEKDGVAKETSLRGTLATVLSVVNGTNKSVQDSFAPAAVINALKRLGWVIPAGEQDAHELLNVILTTLDEETQKMTRKAGCLSDALGMNEIEMEVEDDNQSEFSSMGSVMSLNELCRSTGGLNFRGSGIRRNRWISRSCRALQMSGPPPQPATHPFTGTLTSQLRCTECGFKSAVRYDKFESLSLALPSGAGDLGWGRHKLHQLLTNFVTPEVVQDVHCEGCNKDRDPAVSPILSRQIKILNFGKLPVCLCIHISRNIWSPSGISKRQDYVQFPMRLSMSAYTFIQVHYQRKLPGLTYTSTSEGGSPLSSNTPLCWAGNSLSEMSNEFRNVYQLAAVVVHTGDAYSGHFITYRRGHFNNRWFYTSDIEIKEVSIDEVLQSTAYLLFYEKSSSMSAF
ncbi:ubiquitin carboxyl-terminal hydrolase 30 homolog [Sitophilus oryzae]|uniref:Ubiquitin carboxyl-terminal hydrolase 30 homolog n=1 Tax=Sitophilus oryzae TaxID=7048 RepID=A0A6J2XU83_SITOR|nr:ubiquitin carboxyl-terminal hydrolase 30 homolog [Sitophilus oryzae]XP_030754345.1 ubiquitin carboxyl-terminal hydrolase 30 homolog [Sitophilus oryzae]